MKILSKSGAPRVQLKNIPDGSYRVKVVKVEEKSRDVVENGKKPYAALRVSFAYVSPKYKEFFGPTAMIFMSSDEQSSYIQTGSKYDKWMQAITGMKDYSSLDPLKDLKGKEVVAKVKTDKYTNVVDMWQPKEEPSTSGRTGALSTTPASNQTSSASTSQPATKIAAPVSRDEFVDSGEELEPVAVGDEDDL